MSRYTYKKYSWGAIALLLIVVSQGSLAADVTSEAVEALYIRKLRTFIKVENGSRPPSLICYYEKAGIPVNESVGQLLAKHVKENTVSGNQAVAVKWIKAIRNLSSMGCDIFYIPASADSDIDNIITSLEASSTLTVSSADRFILRGGMIGFVVDSSNRVKMTANIENIKKRGIWVDSQALELMQQVIGANQ
jgi:hypothetical protein